MTTNSLQHLRIVAIDDEKMLLTILSSVLIEQGAFFYGTTTLTEGLKLIKEKMPDLIILDRHLRDEDGLEMVKYLKQNRRLSSIPILMLTGENRSGEVDKAMNIGASWYVLKPFRSQALVDRAICAINKEKVDSQGEPFYVEAQSG